ncbi:MAG: OmpA family protein, partial [Desulfobacterales bacterium]|nr:OmpA family protein [Desulfobacterales bacterium]
LKANPNVKVTIEGHCDDRGTNEYNLALGEARARSAKAFLVDMGVPAARMATISYGEERPAVRGDTEEAWVKNRRAHFVIEQ